MLLEKQGNEATRVTSGSDALHTEAFKLKQRSVGKTRSGPVDPNEVQCCAVAWSYSFSNRAAYISINCSRAVKTMPART